MNLVIGATGLLGGEICRQLVDGGKPVKALVRPTSDPVKVEALQRLGATLVQGDLKDRSSLDAACHGVTTVISTASSTLSRQPDDSIQTVDLEGQLSLVDAAKAAGVEHFIFISFRSNPDHQYPLDDAKRTVEQHLKTSGLTYTILQAGYFMEVWLGPALGFDYANASARIYGDGHNGLSWISYKDVAQFAVASLDNPAGRNAVIEVGGPQALSPLEVVHIFEEVGGQPLAIERVPEDALRAQKANATDPLQESFAALMITYANGDPIEMEATLQAFPLQLASVRDYAEGVLTG
ncbi:MAG: SDR family oxidoreductase [Gammaproteobacteria bacterium]|nr:SDR family oxidoreductase [Gammaproteobacteria bacterium]